MGQTQPSKQSTPLVTSSFIFRSSDHQEIRMKAFILAIAAMVLVASVVATPEEFDTLEEVVYGSEPMVKRGRFVFCSGLHGESCICDRRFRKKDQRRYLNCRANGLGNIADAI
nr:uncharacterized protein LOC129269961 [Lytechinus pictus]